MDAVSGDRTHKSVALEHSEWLSLLDIDGPFLSLPVLLHPEGFPQGLERVAVGADTLLLLLALLQDLAVRLL